MIPHRLPVLGLLIGVLLPACGERSAQVGEEIAPTPSAAPSEAPSANIGDPLAPLPLPLADGTSLAEADLAGRVVAGGEDAVPALLTALQKMGAGIRGPGGEWVAGPPRAFVVESWEVRPMAALARGEDGVLIRLVDLAETLRATFPELAGAPLEQMLLTDVQAHADNPDSRLHAWASFLVELGRATPGLEESALGTAADPRTVIINGLQASLLLRQLGTDLLVQADVAQPPSARLELPGWLRPTPLYAAETARPCTMTPTAQRITDVGAIVSAVGVGGMQVGFGGVLGYLEGKLSEAGQEKLDRVNTYMKLADSALAYVQLITTYLSLEAEIALDAPPLQRTRNPRPQHGDRGTLFATIRMNTGNLQMTNCTRMLLNSVGLDFSLPNDGALEGAVVSWKGLAGFDQRADAYGGPEYLVHFVEKAENRIQSGKAWRFTSSTDVINQETDKDGIARVGVEGSGQKRKLPQDARPVMREATAAIHVAVKGADIFGDLKDASGSAAGGVAALWKLPVEILLRMQWARAGHHTFPVRDWSAGGGWSGTVQVTVNTSGTVVEHPPVPEFGGSTYTLTRSLTASFQFTNGVGHWQAKERSTWDGKGHCMYEPQNTSSTLDGSGPAWMEVGEEGPREEDLPNDDELGTGVIGFAYDPVRTAIGITGLRLRGRISGTRTECDENLRPVRFPVSGETSMDYFPLGTVYGKFPDPRGASELSGTFTGPVEDALSGLLGTMTVTWNLRRE